VTVAPSSATVRTTRSRPFTATVTGAPNTVTWSVNGIPGGNSVVGLIDGSGSYTAPSIVPNPSVVTVAAASTTTPSASGSASVTIIPLPGISSVSPSPVIAGAFTLTVTGAGFIAGSAVSFDGATLPTTFVSSTQLRASGNAPSPKASAPVAVSTPDGETSNTFYVDVVAAAGVSVTISPTSATVRVNRTKQFAATVQNSSNTTVTWKVNGVVGGNATVGTISSSGLYRAPGAVPNPATVTISATSVADLTKSAGAAVTVTRK